MRRVSSTTITEVQRWNATAHAAFGPIEIVPTAAEFTGAMTRRAAADLSIADVISTPASVRGVHAGEGLPGHFVLLNETGPFRVHQGGTEAEVGDRSVTAIRSDQPYEIVFDCANRMRVLHVPPRMSGVDWSRSRGVVTGSDDAVILTTIARGWTVDGASRAHADAYARMLVDALAVTWPIADVDDDSDTMALWGERIDRYLATHLCDPDLGAAQVGAALGASARYVQLVMAARGVSLSAHVLDQRLRLAGDHLVERPDASVTEIAFGVGFVDLSHFCRAFKARFGCSASQWRRRELRANA